MAKFTIEPFGYSSIDNKKLNNATIHPTAIVHTNSEISEGCVVGPFCVIGNKVKLEKNVHLLSSVIVEGDVTIGDGTVVYPFAVIGVAPQDLKFGGELGRITIGKNNSIREHCTIHMPTQDGGGLTSIGDNCLLMVNTHVAHDVHIGNYVVIANNVMLGGHAVLEDNTIIGGGTAVHQFCRVGEFAFVGGVSGITQDIVPYALYTGIREGGEINGINFVGLRRHNYSKEDLYAIRNCYDVIFDKNNLFKDSIEKAAVLFKDSGAAMKIINFILASESKSIMRNYRSSSQDDQK